VNYLIEALPADMKLEIIGHAGDDKYLAELKSLATGRQVVFRHDSADAALVDAYRNAACVVLPSVYRTSQGYETRVPELLGQTLLEGMACGIPAICTDVASMPEVVADRVTGFVVPPNDPASLGERLRWLRDHPEQSRDLGVAGRKRVLEHFTWGAVVDRCLAIYQS
jgi:glycosyltransferase involved in cell wall biosynthesis